MNVSFGSDTRSKKHRYRKEYDARHRGKTLAEDANFLRDSFENSSDIAPFKLDRYSKKICKSVKHNNFQEARLLSKKIKRALKQMNY